MPFVRFSVLTLIGSFPWSCSALAIAGEALGSDWTSVRKGFEYVDYVDPRAVVLGIGYLLVRRRRGRRLGAASRDPQRPAPARRGSQRGAAAGCRRARRSRSGCCRARPSCCRSPPRRTPRCPVAARLAAIAELDDELRKSFEVALHGGAGAGAGDRHAPRAARRGPARWTRAARCVVALSLAPPALAGWALQRPIERRLGGPARRSRPAWSPAALAMALADARAPGRRTHGRDDAGPLDGLALGLAQALALAPGVSRSGATLTAARARGFRARCPRALLARRAAGHPRRGALKGAAAGASARARDGAAGAPLAAGVASAFVSTLASAARLRRDPRARDRPLLPYALYRCLLAALVIARMRGGPHGERPFHLSIKVVQPQPNTGAPARPAPPARCAQ